MACGPAGIPAKCGNRVVSRQKLFRALVGMIAVSGLLQGFHNVARVDLPSSVWGAGETGVGLLQAVAAGSTVAGALLFLSAPKYFPVPAWPWRSPSSPSGKVGTHNRCHAQHLLWSTRRRLPRGAG